MKTIFKKMGTKCQRFFTAIALLPQLIVAHFVAYQNKDRTFVQQYAYVWFTGLVCWVCLTIYCYKIDFEVLYALKVGNSSGAVSWKEPAFNAAVIQFLLLFCGGGFFKNLIFRDFLTGSNSFSTLNKAHTIQLVILGGLFIYGFSWTLDLSKKTGALARVEHQSNVDDISKRYQENTTTLKLEQNKKLDAYRADAKKQILSIETNYKDRIESVGNKYAAIFAQYEDRYKQGTITGAYLKKRVSSHKIRKEEVVAPLLEERAEKIEAVQKDLTNKLNAANSLFKDNKRSIDYQVSNARSEVNSQIKEMAEATQGRNVQYNIFNQFLWVALLIFANCAKKDNKPTKPSKKPSKKQLKRAAPASATQKSSPSHTTGKKQPKRAAPASATQKRPPSHTTATDTHRKESHTDVTKRPVETKNNLHNTTQQGSWQKFRWPRAGDEPTQITLDGYSIKATTKTVWIEYRGVFHSVATVKSWAKIYEKRKQFDNAKYKEYCKMITLLEETKNQLDQQEPLQRAV